MPYQPTNPYPCNVGVDLRDGLTLQFKVDDYDTIIKFKIEIYDLFRNQKIYTIIREIGEIKESEDGKEVIEGEEQIIQILDETDTLVYCDYYEGDSILPVKGGLTKESICKLELTNYLKTIEQIEYERYYNTVTDFTNFQITDNIEDTYYILDDKNYIVGIKEKYQEFLKSLIKIVLPYQVENNIVQGIGTNVFEGFNNLQEIILPTSFYAIQDCAFKDCYSLKNIVLGYGLTEIGANVFEGCENLVVVEMVDTIYTIGNACYKNCTNLQKIRISKLITTIPEECFCGNKKLNNINLNNITTIDNNAFEDCWGLLKIELSENWLLIKEGAFKNCKNIYEVSLHSTDIQNKKQIINKGAFEGCESIVELTIPFVGGKMESENEEHLFGYIFGEKNDGIQQYYNENYFMNYAIPSSVAKVTITHENKVSYGAFYNCKEIMEINLNEGIEIIEPYAFYNCDVLTKMKIPNTVTEIGVKAFALEEVYE